MSASPYRVHMRMVGTAAPAAMVSEANNMIMVMDPAGVSPGSASLVVAHGPAPMLTVSQMGDNAGTALIAGDPADCNAYMAAVTGGVERLRVGPEHVAVFKDFVANEDVRIEGNAVVYGSMYASRYDNLIDDFTSPSIFQPPTAAALARAFVTLSNFAGSLAVCHQPYGGGSNIGGSGSNIGGSNAAWCFEDAEAVLMGSIAVTDLLVLPGGSVNARSFCNLVDNFRSSELSLPPTAHALNAAYVQLSNFVVTRLAEAETLFSVAYEGDDDGGMSNSSSSSSIISNLMHPPPASQIQADMWIPSTDGVDRLFFDAMSTVTASPGGFAWRSSSFLDAALPLMSLSADGSVEVRGGMRASGSAVVGGPLQVRSGGLSVIGETGVAIEAGGLTVARGDLRVEHGDAVFSGGMDMGGSLVVGGIIDAAGGYCNLPVATADALGVTTVSCSSFDPPLSNVAASTALLKAVVKEVDDEVHMFQGLIGDAVYAAYMASNVAFAASNQANAYTVTRSYASNVMTPGIVLASTATASNTGVQLLLRNDGGAEASLSIMSSASGNDAVLATDGAGALRLRAGHLDNAACVLTVGSAVDVDPGPANLELPPDAQWTSSTLVADVNDTSLSFSCRASSIFSPQDDWCQPFQGLSRSPQSTSWISAQGTYGTTTGAPTPTTSATTFATAANGTQQGVVGEWLEFTVSSPVYADSFRVQSSNPYYVPDGVVLLASSDGGSTWDYVSLSRDSSGVAAAIGNGGDTQTAFAAFAVAADARSKMYSTFRLVVTRIAVTQGYGEIATVAQVDVFKIRGNLHTPSPNALFAVDGSSFVVARGGAGIGVGTSSPSAMIHVGNRVAPRTVVLYDQDPSAPDDRRYRGMSVEPSTLTYRVEGSTVDHVFNAGPDEILRVKGIGRVGVMTPYPDRELDVAGSVNVRDALVFGASRTAVNSNGDVFLPPRSTSNIGGCPGLSVHGVSGNVGVGAGTWPPACPLDVGALPVRFWGGAEMGTVACFSESNVFAAPAGNAFLTPASFSCNVGIGTDAPVHPLHVASVDDAGISMYCQGDIASRSDARTKTDVRRIDGALDRVSQIGGYTYANVGARRRRHAGLLAQEVARQLPEAVHEDADGQLSVSYGNMVAVVVEAVKELRLMVEENRQMIAALRGM